VSACIDRLVGLAGNGLLIPEVGLNEFEDQLREDIIRALKVIEAARSVRLASATLAAALDALDKEDES
jgi:hypothetical protein